MRTQRELRENEARSYVDAGLRVVHVERKIPMDDPRRRVTQAVWVSLNVRHARNLRSIERAANR